MEVDLVYIHTQCTLDLGRRRMSTEEAVSIDNVLSAASRLKGKVQETPLLESVALNNMTGARILVKAECLQTAGSFKIRGALHRVLRLTREQRAKGVVAFSSGNFGQGLAAACSTFFDPPVKCTIVMPGDAPLGKQKRAKSYGANVVLSDIVEGVNREVTAAELAEALSSRHAYTLLHPFEDVDVIAGQGSCAVEICEQCRRRGVDNLDALLIPHGGGGLSAGCSLATNAAFPNANIYVVEPEFYDDMRLSLAAGKRIGLEGNPPSLCDALQAVKPGANTFPINQRLLSGALVVNDSEVRNAMKVAFETLQIVLEPGGATGLAAVLSNKLPDVKGKTICIIASGGNLSLEKYMRTVSRM